MGRTVYNAGLDHSLTRMKGFVTVLGILCTLLLIPAFLFGQYFGAIWAFFPLFALVLFAVIFTILQDIIDTIKKDNELRS